MNLIIGGKLNKRNALGFSAYTAFLMAAHLCILLNVYFAEKSGINLGLVTIAWRASIFIGAFLDYVLFKTKLKYYHFLGLTLIVFCVCLVSVDHMKKEDLRTKVLIQPEFG